MKFSIIQITALLAAFATAAPDFIEDHPNFIAKRQGCGGNSGYSGGGYSGGGYSGGGYSGGGYSGGGYSGYKKRDVESTSMSLVTKLFGRQQSNPCRPNAQCQNDDNCVGGYCYNPNPQCQVYGTCQCAGS